MEVIGQLHVPAVLPPEKNHGSHRIGGRVSHRAGLDALEKIKSRSSTGIRTSYRPSRSLVTVPVGSGWIHLFGP